MINSIFGCSYLQLVLLSKERMDHLLCFVHASERFSNLTLRHTFKNFDHRVNEAFCKISRSYDFAEALLCEFLNSLLDESDPH